MYTLVLIHLIYLALTTALPSPKDVAKTDHATSNGNSSSGGNSTSNSTMPTKGGIELTPNPKSIFKDDQALLKDQEAKAKTMEEEDLLESVSGGWWEDIEADALHMNNETISNVTKSSFKFGNVTVNNVTTSKSNSSKHSFSYDDHTLKNVTVLRPRKVSSSLKRCLKDDKVPSSYEGDKDWNTVSRVYNERRSYTPDVVVLPTNTDHVKDAVNCARKAGIKVQPKGGGHSYGSFSTGGKDGSMVVDLRKMDKITYYPSSSGGMVSAEGGTHLGNLALALSGQGRAVPHGDCPAVGLAGHSLHGGFGYASRKWGLSTDSIFNLEVVTANGLIRETSYSENEDLNWALRGAADSFGIVTKLWLRTYEAPKQVTHFSYDLSDYWKKPKTMASHFMDVQRTLRSSSAITGDMGLTVRLTSARFTIAGYYYGSRKEFRKTIQPELDKAMPDVEPELTKLSWNEALARIGGRLTVEQPRNARVGANFFAKSLLTGSRGLRSSSGLEQYFKYLIQNGSKWPGRWVITFRLMGGRGSKVTDSWAEDRSSVSFRDSMWIIQHDGVTNRDPRDMTRFIQGAHDEMKTTQPDINFRSFAPFLDPSLSNSEAHRAYFSSSTYEKLRSHKRVYDPDEVFWNPQSVKP